VDERTLEWLELLGRVLQFAAIAVLVLATIGAIAIATSSSNLPLVGELQEENRGTIALFAFGTGITSAGVLAALGGILLLLVAERRERGSDSR
jgi:glycine/D-amino acid oxidase-like deaminating enzyme